MTASGVRARRSRPPGEPRSDTGSHRPSSPAPGRRLAAHWTVLPWWGRALAVFAVSRVVTTALYVWVGTQASPQSRAGAHPSLVALASAWDGQWYWLIATSGYPLHLPLTAAGQVDTNQWAFLPLYPLLVKVLSLGVVAAWPPVALIVSIWFGFGAAVLLALLLRPHVGEPRAIFAVAVFSVAPLSFLLQATYAESMGLCLLLAALCLIDRHRYWAASPVVVALGLTRPGVLAVALTVGLQLLLRLRQARRGADVLPRRQLLAGAVLAVTAVLVGLAWTAVAAIATGVPDAYFRTELAWRALWTGPTELVLFSPWFFASRYWSVLVLGDGVGPVVAPIVVVLLVAGFAALLVLNRSVRRLGTVSRLWLGSYALYLLAVFFPQSSVFRLLMPMAPLAGALMPRSLGARVALLVGCIALQALWLWCVLGPRQEYWTVP